MHRHNFKFQGTSRSWVTLEWQYNFKCEFCGTLRKMECDVFWGKNQIKIEMYGPRPVHISNIQINGGPPPDALVRIRQTVLQRDLLSPRRMGW